MSLSVFFVPPAVFQWVAESVERSQMQLADLKEVIVAGEELVISEAMARFFKRHSECRLWNHYGPTESHVATVAEVIDFSVASKQSIGRFIDNTFGFILNSDYNLVPLGTTGELFLGGVGLAQGYLGLEDLNKERFIRNPFSSGLHDVKNLYFSSELRKASGADDTLDPVSRLYKNGRLGPTIRQWSIRIPWSC